LLPRITRPSRHPHCHFRGLLRLHSRYGPPDRSAAHRRPLSRGSKPCGYPHEPLVSYRINRQLSGWILTPLMIRAFGAHCQQPTYAAQQLYRRGSSRAWSGEYFFSRSKAAPPSERGRHRSVKSHPPAAPLSRPAKRTALLRDLALRTRAVKGRALALERPDAALGGLLVRPKPEGNDALEARRPRARYRPRAPPPIRQLKYAGHHLVIARGRSS
jgi:hypothetical protein